MKESGKVKSQKNKHTTKTLFELLQHPTAVVGIL